MKYALMSLFMMISCAPVPVDTRAYSYTDKGMTITVVEASPYVIEGVGRKLSIAKSNETGKRAVVLAYMQDVDYEKKTCRIVLPYEFIDPALYKRLRDHEVRHCHGERHDGLMHFPDEAPF